MQIKPHWQLIIAYYKGLLKMEIEFMWGDFYGINDVN